MKTRFKLPILLILFILLSATQSHVAGAFNPRQDPLKISPNESLSSLVSQSDVIALGRFAPSQHAFSLGQPIDSKELVNFTQFFSIKMDWKGHAPKILTVLTTGVRPLPDAESPLNLKYPGALAEGDYICFLKVIPGTPYYRLTTGMQSVYPLISGHTVALKDAGFKSLDHLTPNQLGQKLKPYLTSQF